MHIVLLPNRIWIRKFAFGPNGRMAQMHLPLFQTPPINHTKSA